jgi:hypothetical protein
MNPAHVHRVARAGAQVSGGFQSAVSALGLFEASSVLLFPEMSTFLHSGQQLVDFVYRFDSIHSSMTTSETGK